MALVDGRMVSSVLGGGSVEQFAQSMTRSSVMALRESAALARMKCAQTPLECEPDFTYDWKILQPAVKIGGQVRMIVGKPACRTTREKSTRASRRRRRRGGICLQDRAVDGRLRLSWS